jgi:hypothetical protein
MSHFSFTRTSYDNCAINQKNNESAGPFQWLTDKNVVESKESCFLGAAPFMHNPYNSIPAGSIDIESDLRGQTRLLSKCITDKYNPNTAKPVDYKINECTNLQLVPEYTRTNKSCNIFSGININRFHPLCEDLQQPSKIASNNIIGKNTRLQVKDAIKK